MTGVDPAANAAAGSASVSPLVAVVAVAAPSVRGCALPSFAFLKAADVASWYFFA